MQPVRQRGEKQEVGLQLTLLVAALGLAVLLESAPQAKPKRGASLEQRVKEATAVKDRHLKELFRLPAVVGAGVGLSKEDRQPAIQVYVSRRLKPEESKKFPKALEGIPVEVEVTGDVRALPRSGTVPPKKP
jgi:hypothetical protein